MLIEYREVKPPAGYKPVSMIDEDERMRQFRMSEQWRDGQKVDWRDVDRSSGND